MPQDLLPDKIWQQFSYRKAIVDVPALQQSLKGLFNPRLYTVSAEYWATLQPVGALCRSFCYEFVGTWRKGLNSA